MVDYLEVINLIEVSSHRLVSLMIMENVANWLPFKRLRTQEVLSLKRLVALELNC